MCKYTQRTTLVVVLPHLTQPRRVFEFNDLMRIGKLHFKEGGVERKSRKIATQQREKKADGLKAVENVSPFSEV